MKTPNWVFGQRKYEESSPYTRTTLLETAHKMEANDLDISSFPELNFLSRLDNSSEEDIFRRYFSALGSQGPKTA